MADLPSKANVVVIGGGLIGCSTAYHLAKRGVTDVVVLEKGKLTSGSTWHAAGMVGQLRSSANITQLLRNSVDLYARLEKETGQATGWRATGSLRLCCTEDRRIEYQRAITTAHSFNLEIEMLTPAEIEKLCPGINVSDVLCGVYVPSDGMVNPSDLTMALAKGARSGGVKFFEGIAVTDLDTRDGRICRREDRTGHHPMRRRCALRRPVVAGAGAEDRCQHPDPRRRIITTSSRKRSTASAATCRACAIPTISPTSRRRSAA